MLLVDQVMNWGKNSFSERKPRTLEGIVIVQIPNVLVDSTSTTITIYLSVYQRSNKLLCKHSLVCIYHCEIDHFRVTVANFFRRQDFFDRLYLTMEIVDPLYKRSRHWFEKFRSGEFYMNSITQTWFFYRTSSVRRIQTTVK